MVIGFIYYHKKVVGSAWMSVNDFTDEKVESNNMPLTLILSYVLAVLLAFALNGMVIHQAGVASLFFGDEANPLLAQV